MSLGDENKLIKKIEALQVSNRTAEEFGSKQDDLRERNQGGAVCDS